MLLLLNGCTSDKRLLTHCDLPERELWKRSTFNRLLHGPSLLNFLHVKSNLVYLLPGDDPACGLTREDLSGEDWHSLRELE